MFYGITIWYGPLLVIDDVRNLSRTFINSLHAQEMNVVIRFANVSTNWIFTELTPTLLSPLPELKKIKPNNAVSQKRGNLNIPCATGAGFYGI